MSNTIFDRAIAATRLSATSRFIIAKGTEMKLVSQGLIVRLMELFAYTKDLPLIMSVCVHIICPRSFSFIYSLNARIVNLLYF